MGSTNKDHEEKRNFPGDLTRGRPNLRLIPKFDEIPFYDGDFLRKDLVGGWLSWKLIFISTRFLIIKR